ncbi:hypothetical protein BHE74_00056555 [Ensete ventricosum]|nr:hypothetical protein GW17_00062376 [Ensete ventricosum]RWW38225.1 hypothetical protein BHE74_00056555 [Ensete ventricosum]
MQDYSTADDICCKDHHYWNDVDHCLGDADNDACNTWCMSDCRGGECKVRSGLHYCHCYC